MAADFGRVALDPLFSFWRRLHRPMGERGKCETWLGLKGHVEAAEARVEGWGLGENVVARRISSMTSNARGSIPNRRPTCDADFLVLFGEEAMPSPC